jgi:hypothetical protein
MSTTDKLGNARNVRILARENVLANNIRIALADYNRGMKALELIANVAGEYELNVNAVAGRFGKTLENSVDKIVHPTLRDLPPQEPDDDITIDYPANSRNGVC